MIPSGYDTHQAAGPDLNQPLMVEAGKACRDGGSSRGEKPLDDQSSPLPSCAITEVDGAVRVNGCPYAIPSDRRGRCSVEVVATHGFDGGRALQAVMQT